MPSNVSCLSFPGFLELLPRYECCYVRTQSNDQQWLDVFDYSIWSKFDWLPEGELSQQWRDDLKTHLTKAKELSSVLTEELGGQPLEVRIAGDAHTTPLRLGMAWDKTRSADWKYTSDLGDGTVPVWSAASNQSFDNLAGTLESFSQHAVIFNDKSVIVQIERELLQVAPKQGIEAIGKVGRQSLRVMVDGKEQSVDVAQISLQVDAPYHAVGTAASGTFIVDLSDADDLRVPRHSLTPKGSLLMNGEVQSFVLEEPEPNEADAANYRHRFVFKTSPVAAQGAAEITVSLGAKATAKSFVMFLNAPARQ